MQLLSELEDDVAGIRRCLRLLPPEIQVEGERAVGRLDELRANGSVSDATLEQRFYSQIHKNDLLRCLSLAAGHIAIVGFCTERLESLAELAAIRALNSAELKDRADWEACLREAEESVRALLPAP